MIRRAFLLTRRGFIRLVAGVAAAQAVVPSAVAPADASAQQKAEQPKAPKAPEKPFFDDGTDFTK